MSTSRRVRRLPEMLESRHLLAALTFVDHTLHEASEIRLEHLVESDLDRDDDLDLLSGNCWFENVDGQE